MCMLNAAIDIFEKSSMYRRTSINHLSIRATCSDSSPKRFTAFCVDGTDIQGASPYVAIRGRQHV